MKRLERMAGLRLDQEERETLVADLERMLSYCRILQELDSETVPPMTPAGRAGSALREDEVFPSLSQEQSLAHAPEVRGGYFAVPPVFGEPDDESW